MWRRALRTRFFPTIRSSFSRLPKVQPLYSLCRLYCEAVDGEGNGDIRSNGESRLLRQLAPICQTVFDVGANVGNWTAIALAVNPNIAVHCFEPHPVMFEELVGRASRDGWRNVSCQPMALSSSEGTTTLHFGSQSLHRRVGASEEVETTTLDAYCTQHGLGRIDLLKLDVEGHELQVLKGAEETLGTGRVARVQFEYGPENIDAGVLLRDLMGLLQACGFQVNRILPRELVPVPSYDSWLENFRYKNFLAVHRSAG